MNATEEIIPGSYYLEPASTLGRSSKTFFLPLVLEFIRRHENARIVSRAIEAADTGTLL